MKQHLLTSFERGLRCAREGCPYEIWEGAPDPTDPCLYAPREPRLARLRRLLRR